MLSLQSRLTETWPVSLHYYLWKRSFASIGVGNMILLKSNNLRFLWFFSWQINKLNKNIVMDGCFTWPIFSKLKQSCYQLMTKRPDTSRGQHFSTAKNLISFNYIQHYFIILNISNNGNCKIYILILGTMTDLSLKVSTLEADYQNFKSSEVRITLLLN